MHKLHPITRLFVCLFSAPDLGTDLLLILLILIHQICHQISTTRPLQSCLMLSGVVVILERLIKTLNDCQGQGLCVSSHRLKSCIMINSLSSAQKHWFISTALVNMWLHWLICGCTDSLLPKIVSKIGSRPCIGNKYVTPSNHKYNQ